MLVLVSALSARAGHAAPLVDAPVAVHPTIIQTPWAASVRQALAARMHHAMTAWAQHGVASWYGKRFLGHRTSDGSVLDAKSLTAAHPTLPLGSKVLVTSEDTGRSVIVTINDRGPFNNRIIDLSHAAAAQIGMLSAGTAHVKIAPLPADAHPAPMEVAQADPSDTSDQAVAAAAPKAAVLHHAVSKRHVAPKRSRHK